MAKDPTGFTAPTSGILSELYYSATGTAADLTQVFGVQSLPPVITPKDDITYSRLESDVEFAVKGRRPFETIEVSVLHYNEQFSAVSALAAANDELHWYIKLPDIGTTKGQVIHWEGSVDISLAEITDDMLMDTIKIGKSTDPEYLAALPTTTP